MVGHPLLMCTASRVFLRPLSFSGKAKILSFGKPGRYIIKTQEGGQGHFNESMILMNSSTEYCPAAVGEPTLQ